jgi:hypothetical protein
MSSLALPTSQPPIQTRPSNPGRFFCSPAASERLRYEDLKQAILVLLADALISPKAVLKGKHRKRASRQFAELQARLGP